MKRYYIEYRFTGGDWCADTSFDSLEEAVAYCRSQSFEASCEHRMTEAWIFKP